MILFQALNLAFLVSWVRCYQEWHSTQQLVYDIGNKQLSQVFIHFDNQTLEMKGNKDVFVCVQRVKQLTLHCIDTIAIQWEIKGTFLKTLQMNESETEEALRKVQQLSAINETALNEKELEQMQSSKQLICCVLSELFDCMEYTIRKECNDNAFEELKQLHSLIAAEDYTCSTRQRTAFCTKMLKQRKEMEKEPEANTGDKVQPVQLLLIIFQVIVSLFLFNN